MTPDRSATVGAGVSGPTAYCAYCGAGCATHHLDVAQIRRARRMAQ